MDHVRIRIMSCSFLVVAYVIGLAACRDDDNGNDKGPQDSSISETDGSVTHDGTSPGGATIYDIMSGKIAEKETVVLKDVIVTAVDLYGEYTGDIFVQEAQGGKQSAIKIYQPQRIDGGELKDLLPGDHVKVEGVVKYFTPTTPFDDDKHPQKISIIELDKGTQITRLSEGTAPEPVELTIKELTEDPTAAEWEHVLVRVKDLAVTRGVSSEYGDFYVYDGQQRFSADDDLHLGNPQLGDCVTLVGISAYFYSYKIFPRSGADITPGSTCPQVTSLQIADLQDVSSTNHPTVGAWVKVSGVISAVDGTKSSSNSKYTGFWVQQESGGPYSGLYIYYTWKDNTAKQDIPQLNEQVELFGFYDEYKPSSAKKEETQTQLRDVDWINKGAATPIQAEVVSANDLVGGSVATQYEGVLVKVENVEVGSYIEDSKQKKVAIKLSGSELTIDKELFDFMNPTPPELGTKYTSITGPLAYTFDNYKIMPRTAADMVKE